MAILNVIPRTTSFVPLRDMFGRFFEQMNRPHFYVEEDDAWIPASDISENEKEFIVTLEIPGTDMSALDISYSNGMLNVNGEKKKETSEGASCYCAERYSGSFRRSFRVPGDVKTDEIDANYKDGILRLTLPKSEQSKIKKIEIH